MSGATVNQFKQFVDEHSPEQAMQIQREWRKKAQEKKVSCRNRVLIGITVFMIIIFVLLISLLSEQKRSHIELDYPDKNYAYIQSVYPHLKFLMDRGASTTETRLVKALGILYPELIAWIEGSLQPGMRVLLVPNEMASVNVLAIALGFYLQSSESGSLKILIDSPSYRTLTEANLNEMRKQHGQNRFPVQIFSKSQYQSDLYDLIVIENNNFHQQIRNFNQTNLIIIRKETIYNSIISTFFSGHGQYEIVKGLTNAQIRETDRWEGYKIVPYVLAEDYELNIILLLAENYPEVALCPEKIKELVGQEGDRDMVEYLRNKTYNHASIYYQLGETDNAILDAITGFPHVEKVYVLQGLGLGTHRKVVKVSNKGEMVRSTENYYILSPASIGQVGLINGDKVFVKIQKEADIKLVSDKYMGDSAKMSVILPYNNGGCFYPPQVVPFTGRLFSKAYFLLIEMKGQAAKDQN